MSNVALLTWDNMEEVIASLPKDDNGRFLPNPNKFEKKELTLSTERDSWTEEAVDLLNPISEARKNLITNPTDIILCATEVATGITAVDIKNKIIDVLVDDGFLYNKEHWVNAATFDYVDDLLVLKTDAGVLADIREEPIYTPDESVVKLNYTKLYVVCRVRESKPEPVVEKKTTTTGNYFSEDTSEGEELFPTIDPLLRAQQALVNLDTTTAEAELAGQAEAFERNKQLKESGLLEIANSPLTNPTGYTPEELKVWAEANIAKAKNNILGVDKLITYAGRLNVKDKFLMNCPADLNQLIPFKYNWAWSFYLTSSANHWMPGESNLYSITEEYKTVNSSIKKLVARAWFNHQAKLGLFGEGILVNLYRQITNPESRQYLLRQGQEFIVVRHAWLEINDCLNVKDTLIDGLTPAKSLVADNDTFNRRTIATRKHIQHMRDLTSTTETTEKLASFLKSFIIGYTCTNWLSPLVSYYQAITALEFNETCQPLAHIFMNLIRDNISQFEFAKLFIAGVIEENPTIVTPEWRDEVYVAINELIAYEIKLTQTLTAGENDTDDVAFICQNYRDDVMSIIDPTYQRLQPQGDCTRGYEFVQLIKNLSPKVDHNAGLGAVQW